MNRFVVRTPVDLVAATPYLLGFHPTDSIVVIAFRDRGLLGVARLGLPELLGPPDSFGDALVDPLTRQDVDTLAVVGFGSAARVDLAVPVVRAAATRHRLQVKDALRVDGGRWWSYLCRDPRCCPPEGTPFDPASSEVAARCAAMGLMVWPSRADLEQQVAPVGGRARVSMSWATERARRRFLESGHGARLMRARGRRLVREASTAVEVALRRYEEGGHFDDDEMAWLSVVLTSTAVRRTTIRGITTAQPHMSLWTDATRRVDPALVVVPACLLAFTAWRFGRPALAQVAVERALRACPSDPTARQLWLGMLQGPPPATFDELVRKLEAMELRRAGELGRARMVVSTSPGVMS